MAFCAECGKEFNPSILIKAFGKTTRCPKCREERKKKINLFLEKVREAGKDRYLSKEEESLLKTLQQELGLQNGDIIEANRQIANLKILTKQADVACYEKKLEQFGEDKYLTPEEEEELEKLKKELSLTESDLQKTQSELLRLRRFTALKNGYLPELTPDILLQKNEKLHYEVYCSLMEEKHRTRYVGGSQGVNFRIMKGVYYRVGGFRGNRVVEEFKEITDSGFLYITNKRIIFNGSKKNVTYAIPKIVNMIRYSDAWQFQKENESKPKYFIINDSDAIDEIGLILNSIYAQTQKEER